MKKQLFNSALFMGSCLVILLPSIINGYPILFSDTGTYIASGMESFVPIDRPVFYGLFLRLSSLWISLWFTAILQAVMVVLFMVLTFKYIFSSSFVFRNTLIAISILSATTSLAYFTNHIVPDIFASMVIIGVVLLVSRPRLPIWLTIVLLVMLIFINLVHLSNLLITTSLTGVAIVGGLIFIRKKWFRERALSLVFLGILTLSSWILLPSVNYFMGEGFVTSRVKNIFMVGNLIENGMLKNFLEENCQDNKYELCEYLDELPDLTFKFLWEYDSPLYDEECMEVTWVNCWLKRDPEYGIMLEDLFANPKYMKKYIWISIRTSLKQTISYEIQDRRSEGVGSPVRYPMEQHFSGDYERYISAKQQEAPLTFKALSVSQKIIVPVALIFLALCFLMPGIRKKIPSIWIIFTLGILLAIIANAFICATFSHWNPRYQSRVIWMIPMLAIAYLLQFKSIGLNLLNYLRKPADDNVPV